MVDEQAALALVALYMQEFRDAVCDSLTARLEIRGPFRPPGQTGHFIVDACIADHRGGISTHAAFSVMEVLGLQDGALLKLILHRGKQAGEDISYMLMSASARALVWQTAGRGSKWRGRWRRLKWAWSGVIPDEIVDSKIDP